MRYTLKNIAILTVAFFLTIVTFSTSFAANVEMEMLNKQDKERMVYSQKIVRVNVGEKVIWKATSKGHNVEFIKGGVPEGVKKFKSKTNKDTDFTFVHFFIFSSFSLFVEYIISYSRIALQQHRKGGPSRR